MTWLLSLIALALGQDDSAGRDPALRRKLLPQEAVEALGVPAPTAEDRAEIEGEDRRRELQGLPPRFAIPHGVHVTPDDHGLWENLDADTLVWRLAIRAPGARSVNLGFGTYHMPEGGELWLYSPDLKHVVRPFTAADNEDHGQLWTPVVESDELLVELSLPAAKAHELRLVLTQVGYGYRGFGQPTPAGSLALSQSCNVDVACPEGDPWRLEIPSVGVYSLAGVFWCTGTLLNNVRNDYTPYFLTARHCGVNQSAAPTMVVYWNYANSFCRAPGSAASGQAGNGSLTQFNSGSKWRASYLPTDFTLLELDDDPDPAFELTWAGWDATGADATSAVGIHHPNTEEKRISFEYDKTRTTNYFSSSPNPNGTHVRVANWDLGITEIGSSGSALFNQDHRVIGQLDGGTGSCATSVVRDWYGKFAVSFVGEGPSKPKKALKTYLDPDDTGVLVVDSLPECPDSSVTFENGSGLNPSCLKSINTPVIGGEWHLEVDTRFVSGATSSTVRVYAAGLPGTVLPQGELLVDVTSTLIASSTSPSTGGLNLHTVHLDDDPSLAGTTLHVQAAVLAGDAPIGLCNSEVVLLGCAP